MKTSDGAVRADGRVWEHGSWRRPGEGRENNARNNPITQFIRRTFGRYVKVAERTPEQTAMIEEFKSGRHCPPVVGTANISYVPGFDAAFDAEIVGKTQRLYTKPDAEYEADNRGYIYLAAYPHRPDIVKIGLSRDPRKRVRSAQTFIHPNEAPYLVRVYRAENMKLLERLLHERFDPVRVEDRNEMFMTDVRTALSAIDQIIEEDAQHGEDPVCGPGDGRAAA